MKLYMTQGTTDYLERLRKSCDDEKMHLFTNDFNSLLVHETTGLPVFKEPIKYVVIQSVGKLDKVGYLILNYIPVTDEGKPIFEFHYKQENPVLLEAVGFEAYRVLRPVQNNTYVLLTLWESETAYKDWKKAKSYPHEKDKEKIVTSQPPYVKTYYTYEGEDNN